MYGVNLFTHLKWVDCLQRWWFSSLCKEKWIFCKSQ